MPLVEFSDSEPPQELLAFLSGGLEEWTSEGFAALLRAREAWRDAHREPLPPLPARERHAMSRLDLPTALVQAEERAPRSLPEWRSRRPQTGVTGPRRVPRGD